MAGSPDNRRSLLSRLVWFAALWLAGVGTVAAVAYGIRFFIT
jgi:hypothetical protein